MTREHVSISQFCELLAIPSTLCGVEVDIPSRRVTLMFQEAEMAETSGTMPQLTQGGKRVGGKKAGGKKKC